MSLLNIGIYLIMIGVTLALITNALNPVIKAVKDDDERDGTISREDLIFLRIGRWVLICFIVFLSIWLFPA